MPIQDQLPKSRITLVYRTEINGQKEDVKLPFRVVVLGDFSQGSSTDSKLDLEEREARSITGANLNEVMKDMGMSVSFEVDDKVSSEAGGKMTVSLPIERMKSFHPDEIINHVPKLKALLLLRKLLLEMQSDIDNRKDLRRAVHELFSDKEQVAKLLESEQLKSYASMRLPVAKPRTDAPALAAANSPAQPGAKA